MHRTRATGEDRDVKHDDENIEDHDRGLAFDRPRLVSRRRAVGLLAMAPGSAAEASTMKLSVGV